MEGGFKVYGRFCSSYPWQVIVLMVALTMCLWLTSKGDNSSTNLYHRRQGDEKADTFLMIVVISLAGLNLYNQFSHLRKQSSNFTLGVVSLTTIIASVMFCCSVAILVNLTESRMTGLKDALPFFFLLVNLTKATRLASIVSQSKTRDEVQYNISRGMAKLGPSLSLDTLVKVLIVSVGSKISGIHQLEAVCWSVSLSFLTNYIVLMTFFPALLSLASEVCPSNTTTPPVDSWSPEEEDRSKKRVNPVTQRVKVIMSVGLIVVHLHSQFVARDSSEVSLPATPTLELASASEPHKPVGPWDKIMSVSADTLVAVGLGILLLVRYVWYDKPIPSTEDVIPGTDGTPTPDHDAQLNERLLAFHFKTTEPSCTTQSIGETVPSRASATTESSSETVPSRASATNEGSSETVPSRASITTKGTCSSETVPSRASATTEGSSETVPSRANITTQGSGDVISQCASDTVDKKVTSDTESNSKTVEQCLELFKSEGAHKLSDDEIVCLVEAKHIPSYKLETSVGDHERGVAIRRQLVSKSLAESTALEGLPHSGYDYNLITGACCENVIGYMTIPVGVAGPLLLDGHNYHVPMSTTEGCLVASTNRGCRALASCDGVHSSVVGDGMTRGPVLRMPSAVLASSLKLWLDDASNFAQISHTFNSTSSHASLTSLHTVVAGRLVFVRFRAHTGDAMGMNMISKGVEASLNHLQTVFPAMEVVSLSGNYCTDKKPSAVNWIEGRGKYVVCEATVPAPIVEKVLKTTVDALIDVNISKNLVGSAMAGSIGGFNAHAANIVTAVFIATGQDPAQVVGSSNCITLLERGGPQGDDLHISCTMPSLEVGTVGGGTFLPAQSACLKMLGVHGSSPSSSLGEHSNTLARVVCATVLAGELSLLSALAAGHLVKSHLKMNRSKTINSSSK